MRLTIRSLGLAFAFGIGLLFSLPAHSRPPSFFDRYLHPGKTPPAASPKGPVILQSDVRDILPQFPSNVTLLPDQVYREKGYRTDGAATPAHVHYVHVIARSKERDGRRDLLHWAYGSDNSVRWHRIITPTSLPVDNIDEPPVGVINQNGAQIFSRWGNRLIYWKCSVEDLETASSGDVACTATILNPHAYTPAGDIRGCVTATTDPRGQVHVIAKGHWDQGGGNDVDGYFLHWDGNDMNNFVPEGPVRANEVYARLYGHENYVRPESCPGMAYNDHLHELEIFSRGPWGDLTMWWLPDEAATARGWGVREYGNYTPRVPGGEDGQSNGRVVAIYSPSDYRSHAFFHDDSPIFSGKFNGIVHAYGFGERDFDYGAGRSRYTSHIWMDTLGMEDHSDNGTYASIDHSPVVLATKHFLHIFGWNGSQFGAAADTSHLIYHRLEIPSYSHQSRSFSPSFVLTAPAVAIQDDGAINIFGRNTTELDSRGEGLARIDMIGAWTEGLDSLRHHTVEMPAGGDRFLEIEGFPSVLTVWNDDPTAR